MKAQSGSVVLFHYLPGQHAHVAEWHNEIHRPEIQGAVPHVFYSQDFVAPPAYVAARQHADLPMDGGEYLSVYWSEGDADQYAADSRAASQDRRNAGSYHPFQDVVWAARFRAGAAHARKNLGYDVNAAPLTPNSGLILIAERVADAARVSEYTTWLRSEHVPRVLELGTFSAHFDFLEAGGAGTLMVRFLFIDRADPLESLAQLRRHQYPSDIESLRSVILSAPYQPVITGQYDTYV
jgi:hypothetical protein